MKKKFFEPGAFAEFCAGSAEVVNRLRRERRAKTSAAPRKIVTIERRQKEILDLESNGVRPGA